MKVLFVINFLADTGGAEKLMESLLPYMKSKGVDVSVAVFDDWDCMNKKIIQEAGIEVITIGKSSFLYNPIKILQLRKVMKQFDIVHSHLTAPFFFCALNKPFCIVKLVNTIHSTYSKCRKYFILRGFEKWALNQYDCLIPCSKEAEVSLRSFLGQTNKWIMTINNGIELKKFIFAESSVEMIREGRKNITMVSVFRAEKDPDTLIRALTFLPEIYHVNFIGNGETMDSSKKLAEKLCVSNRVHFWGKRVDVANILKASDFVVLSSHYEGLSLASIESMACGAPFIASDVPGLHDLVHGYGELFEEGNYKQLSDIILCLASDTERYQDIVHRCQERASEYDISKMGDSYIDVYNQLMTMN